MAKSAVLEQLVSLSPHRAKGISRLSLALAAAGIIMSIGCKPADVSYTYVTYVDGARVSFKDYDSRIVYTLTISEYQVIIEERPNDATITYKDIHRDGELDLVTVSSPNATYGLDRHRLKNSNVGSELFEQHQITYSALLSLIKERLKQDARPGLQE